MIISANERSAAAAPLMWYTVPLRLASRWTRVVREGNIKSE